MIKRYKNPRKLEDAKFNNIDADARCRKTEEDKWGKWISPQKMTVMMRDFYPKERKKYVSAIQNALNHALRRSRKKK